MKRIVLKNSNGVIALPCMYYSVNIRFTSEIYITFFGTVKPYDFFIGSYDTVDEAREKIFQFNKFLDDDDRDVFYF